MSGSGGNTVLALRGVGRMYGSLAALSDVSFSVSEGSRHAVIGPNGAGKSTLFNLIAGLESSTSGSIEFAQRDITDMSAQRRCRLGIVKTFQHSSLFPELTIEENVAIGVHSFERSGHHFLRPKQSFRSVRQRVLGALEQVRLDRGPTTRVDELSHGESRQLELALALCMQPQVLMLDEPVAGMSPAETSSFVDLIRSLAGDVTVLLVEHDLDVVLRLAERITVLDAGRVIADGPPAEVTTSKPVRDAYLGTSFDLRSRRDPEAS